MATFRPLSMRLEVALTGLDTVMALLAADAWAPGDFIWAARLGGVPESDGVELLPLEGAAEFSGQGAFEVGDVISASTELLVASAVTEGAAPDEGATSISAAQILVDRPDVLAAYYEQYYGPSDGQHSTAWRKMIGGSTPEAFAEYWYAQHGKFEGYSQSAITAQDNVSVAQILVDRPDVLKAFYTEFYGPNNDRDSGAWIKRVGGDTPEAYARYWYDKYGKWEGYSQSERQAANAIDVERLLNERPDVFKKFYAEFNGPGNDHKSHAWIDRVGGDTVQDYAKYWYVAHGRFEGYTQAHPSAAPSPEAADLPGAETDTPEMAVVLVGLGLTTGLDDSQIVG